MLSKKSVSSDQPKGTSEQVEFSRASDMNLIIIIIRFMIWWDMNLIIRPTKSTLSTCSGQQMTVEGCTWLTATANNVAIRAKSLLPKA